MGLGVCSQGPGKKGVDGGLVAAVDGGEVEGAGWGGMREFSGFLRTECKAFFSVS